MRELRERADHALLGLTFRTLRKGDFKTLRGTVSASTWVLNPLYLVLYKSTVVHIVLKSALLPAFGRVVCGTVFNQSDCIIYALIQSEMEPQPTLPIVGDNSLFKTMLILLSTADTSRCLVFWRPRQKLNCLQLYHGIVEDDNRRADDAGEQVMVHS